MASLRALQKEVAALDAFALTATADLTASCGSLILALALRHGRIDAGAACDLALLDELFQMERWGEDREALQRQRRLRADTHAAVRFLELLSR